MVWRVVETYTKECGCECEDTENDVDRPFMCYTEYNTNITKRCVEHARQEQEYQRIIQERERREIQQKDEMKKILKSHLVSLANIEHKNYVPIKSAISKYREHFKTHNSDRWIKDHINYYIGYVLMIQKIKNRWVCSKEKLEYSNFKFIFDLCGIEVDEVLREVL